AANRHRGAKGLRALAAHLLKQTVTGRLVLAPAQDPGAVADAPAAHVIECHLDDQLGPQLDPLELLLALPAAGVAVSALAGLVGLELVDERPLLGRPQTRGVTDHVQPPARAIQA